jgi:hypothetical protein
MSVQDAAWQLLGGTLALCLLVLLLQAIVKLCGPRDEQSNN